MSAPDDGSQGMAALALKQLQFLFLSSRNTLQPFRTRQLRGKILGLTKLQVFLCTFTRYDLNWASVIQFITGRSYAKAIFSTQTMPCLSGRAENG